MAISLGSVVVGAAASSFVVAEAVAAGYIIAGGIAANVLSGVVMFGVSYGIQSAFGPSRSDSVSNKNAQGLLVNAIDNVGRLPVVYGFRRVGGTLVYVSTSVDGESNPTNLHLVVALCEGPVSSLEDTYFNGIRWDDPSFNKDKAWEFRDPFTIYEHLGSDSQTYDTVLGGAVTEPRWTSNHRGRGIAYLYAHLIYAPEAFPSIPTISCDVKGRLVYNARTGNTVYSTNPAWVILDYLTNDRYGCGIPLSAIDVASFITVEAHCDEKVNTPEGQIVRYNCVGVVETGNTLLENLTKLLTSCRGFLVVSGDKFRLKVDKAEIPTSFSFSEENIVGDWTITRPGRDTKFNRVVANYFDEENWQPTVEIVESPSFLLADADVVLEGTIDLPFTTNKYRVQHLAGLHLKTSRYATTVEFTAFQSGLRCEVGDVVKITHATPGWVDKPIRITKIVLSGDHQVRITAIEHEITVYDLDTLTTFTGGGTCLLPNYQFSPVPTGLQVSSTREVNTGSAVIKQLHITWNIPSVLVPAVEVWVNSGGDFEHHSTVTGTTNSYTVPAVQIGRVYEVKLRSKNAFNVYSDFCTSVFHTVALPTELFWRSYGAMIAPFWKNRNVTPVTMTSNHSEGALVTASNESYGAGWHALTSGAYAGWEADTSFAWLQVRLDVAPLVPVTKMFLQGPPDDEGKTPQEFTLHGSHDGVTWNLLLYFYWGPVVPVGLKSYEFSNTELWTYYKLTVTNTAGGGHTGLRIFSLHNTRFWSH